MNRQQAKELLPIIKAFAEGKTIQYYTNLTPHWVNIDPNESVNFSDYPSNYRIKPEPTYRPFKTDEECWKEMQKHKPFGWVKDKDDKYLITEVSETLVKIGKNYLFQQAKEVFTFADGTPFGIKDE